MSASYTMKPLSSTQALSCHQHWVPSQAAIMGSMCSELDGPSLIAAHMAVLNPQGVRQLLMLPMQQNTMPQARRCMPSLGAACGKSAMGLFPGIALFQCPCMMS